MSGGRNPYTAEDDSYLVKYIATYNPMASGRSGNALYQRLCENADRKWPWSVRHPWQSWRDRYYKNSEAFNLRIKRYMKKHNISAAEAKKLDFNAFLRKRARESEGDAQDENEGGDDGDSRAHKRKRLPESGRVKVKQEPVDGINVEPQGRRREQPEPLASQSKRRERESKADLVKEEEEEPMNAEVKAEAEAEDGSAGDGTGEEESEYEKEDEDEDEDEDDQRSGPVGSDDYAQDIFQSVPHIETEDVSHTESESDEKDDSEPQDDELQETQSIRVVESSSQNGVTSLYPDIKTLPSPHLREKDSPSHPSSPPKPPPNSSKHHTSTRAPPPRSPPQPVASTSKVQLSPSHQLPRGSSLLRDTRPRRKVPKDDDFFASVPATPTPGSPSPPPLVKRKLPQLIEGPFRNAFAKTPQGQESDESLGDEDKPTWPPTRKRKVPAPELPDKGKSEDLKSKAPSTLAEAVQVKEALSSAGPKTVSKPGQKSGEPSRLTEQPAPGDAQTSLPRRVPAPAPPRRVSLPLGPSKGEHHPFSQQTNGHTKPMDLDPKLPESATVQRTSNSERAPTRGESPATTPVHQAEIQKARRASSSNSVLTRKSESDHDSRRQMADSRIQTSSRVITLGGPSLRRSSSLRHEAKLVDHTLPSESYTPGNPFVASKGKGRARVPSLFVERRHTIDYQSEATTSTQHLDLRSRTLHQPRQSLPAPAHIPTATSTPDSASHPSLLPIPIAAEDRFKVEYLGMSAAVTMMSKRFSVAEEVVWRGWEKTKSISKTEEYCRRLAELNAKSEAAVLKEMRKSGIIDAETPARAAATHSTAGSPRSRSRSRRASGQRRLKVMPLLEDDAMSEYTPPSSTRAAQYTRLEKQGRRDEALTREWRRASVGGGSFPHRQRDPGHSSPFLAPGPVRKIGGSEVEYHDVPGETPPATPSRSVTASGENAEDARDGDGHDELDDLDEAAFLSASAQNAEALRERERRVDPDMMIQWTARVFSEVRARANLNQLPHDSVG